MVTQHEVTPPQALIPDGLPEKVTVLVTGGAGFIGSHVCVELLDHGHEVVVADNYSNSSPVALGRVEKVAGRPLAGAYQVDLRNRQALAEIFLRHPIDAVMHFAGKKAVGESMTIPLDYYDNNVGGTTSLLRVMHQHGVCRLVFSSSCSIYGDADSVPISENSAIRPTNPYATSKWLCEQILAEASRRHPDLSVLSLRYFNPIGGHDSGLLGEAPCGVPSNIMPYLMQVAIGRLDRVRVFGHDYRTRDGTAIRDYIHVVDLADAHRRALERLPRNDAMRTFNLGTGMGTTVLELISEFSAACGRPIPYDLVERRPGDVAQLVADPAAVAAEWGWHAIRDLTRMCRDAWRFQELNPLGYQDGAAVDALADSRSWTGPEQFTGCGPAARPR